MVLGLLLLAQFVLIFSSGLACSPLIIKKACNLGSSLNHFFRSLLLNFFLRSPLVAILVSWLSSSCFQFCLFSKRFLASQEKKIERSETRFHSYGFLSLLGLCESPNN